MTNLSNHLIFFFLQTYHILLSALFVSSWSFFTVFKFRIVKKSYIYDSSSLFIISENKLKSGFVSSHFVHLNPLSVCNMLLSVGGLVVHGFQFLLLPLLVFFFYRVYNIIFKDICVISIFSRNIFLFCFQKK